MNKRKGVEMKFNFDKFRRSREDGNLGAKTKRPVLKSIIALSLSFVLMLSCSFAYFTDHLATSTSGTAGTVEVSLDDSGINLLNADGKDILNPGDIRPVEFTVVNKGNKSVDTEVVITVVSSIPMSNTPHIGGEVQTPTLYNKKVYLNEFELYWADDVELVEGYGYYPKAETMPVETRVVSADKMKMVYTIDTNVLSGNSALDEQEIEYMLAVGDKFYLIAEEGVHYNVEHDDLSYYNPDIGEAYILSITYSEICEIAEKLPVGSNINLVLPNEVNVDGNTVPVEYVRYVKNVVDGLTFSVGPNFKNSYYFSSALMEYVFEEIGDSSEYSIYDDYNTLVDNAVDVDRITSLKPYLSLTEYESLSDEDKTYYEIAPDNQTYDFVLLFDPNSGNAFQNSNVAIKIEVLAKQHRNTNDDMWSLADASLSAVIQDSIFTVEYDELRQITLTGVKDGIDLSSLTEITIPVGVQVIPDSFFANLTNLETVNLPATIEEIGESAFQGCTNLTSINLPEGLRAMQAYTFADCSSLDNIVIPDSVVTIGTNSFENCTSLTSIEIPDNVTVIDDYTFSGCSNLSSVELSANLTEIGSYAFNNCTSLQSIELPYGLKTIYSYAFAESGLASIDIPDSVEYIDDYAFVGCANLTNVYLPIKTYEICRGTFLDCTSLISVKIGASEENYFGGWLYAIYDEAFKNTKLNSLSIGSSVGYVGSEAFANIDTLTEITIEGNYTIEDLDTWEDEWEDIYDGMWIEDDAFYSELNTPMVVYTNNEALSSGVFDLGRPVTFQPMS